MSQSPPPTPPTEGPPVEIVEGCGIERYEIYSRAMTRTVRAWTVVPPAYADAPHPFPLLVALHGRHAPYDTHAKMDPLLRGLAVQPMVLAGFDAGPATWYIDAPLQHGSRMETFFFDEFLPEVRRRYRVDVTRESLTGFSMGGFGAMHFALRRPSEFVAVSALSGAFRSFDPPDPTAEQWLTELIGPYENQRDAYATLDLRNRFDALAAGTVFPPAYLACGLEDRLLNANRSFRDFLVQRGFDVVYAESAGAHDWPYWRDNAAGVLDFHWSHSATKER